MQALEILDLSPGGFLPEVGPPRGVRQTMHIYHKGASRRERSKTGLHICASAVVARRLGCPSGAPLDQMIIVAKNIGNTAEGLACNNSRNGKLHHDPTRLNARRSKSYYIPSVQRLPPAGGDHPMRCSRRRIIVHHLQVYASPSVYCILSLNDTWCCHCISGLCPAKTNDRAKQRASRQFYRRRWFRLTEATCNPFPVFSSSALRNSDGTTRRLVRHHSAHHSMLLSFDTDSSANMKTWLAATSGHITDRKSGLLWKCY
ncbi:hypothetical protein F4801DRAFT_456816 [Xylaria longipes]|nr:hypothetical protein F4801DRAFT_456816 [Xylaria longipes]